MRRPWPNSPSSVRVFHQRRSLPRKEIIHSLDDAVLRTHYDIVQAECGRRLGQPSTIPDAQASVKATQRMPGVAIKRAIFDRNSWRCRWCSTPIIASAANKRMNKEPPETYTRGRHNIEIQGLIMCSQGSIDYVITHPLGGSNDNDNLTAACWPCQFARGEIDYARLDLDIPRQRPPVIDAWDGCHWFTN